MNRTFWKLSLAVLALLMLTTGIIAGSTPAPSHSAESLHESALAVNPSQDGSAGMELAVMSIVLGSGMIFLFRPRRMVAVG